MNTATVIDLSSQALVLVLLLSMPAVVTSMLVGLLLGLLQAVTQVQDQSLPYAVKLVAVSLVLALTSGWMGHAFHSFGDQLFRVLASI